MRPPSETASALVRSFKYALERMLVLASERQNVRHLFLGIFVPIRAADRLSLFVDAKHMRYGFQLRHAKELLPRWPGSNGRPKQR